MTASNTGEEKTKSLYLELGKNGLIFNGVYDKQSFVGPFGLKANIGSNFDPYQSVFKAGAGLYKLLGNGERNFELGLDADFIAIYISSDDQVAGFVCPKRTTNSILLSSNIGYRSTSERSVFRIGLSPSILSRNLASPKSNGGSINENPNESLFVGAYLSYGFRF